MILARQAQPYVESQGIDDSALVLSHRGEVGTPIDEKELVISRTKSWLFVANSV